MWYNEHVCMDKINFLHKIAQLESLIILVNKVGIYDGKILTKSQWTNLFNVNPEKAQTLLMQYVAEAYAILATQFPTKEELKGNSGESIKGEDGESIVGRPGLQGPKGKDAPQMEEIKEEIEKLVSQIELPEVKPVVVTSPVIEEPQIIEITKTVYESIDFDVDKEITRSSLAIRNALELIEDEEEKLKINAIGHLPERLKIIEKALAAVQDGQSWNTGVSESEATAIAQSVVDAYPHTTPTWGVITGTLSDQTDLQAELDAKVDVAGDTITGDLVGTDFIRNRDGIITRVGDVISEIELVGGRTLTVTRDVDGYISSVADGTRTWTYTRNASNKITSWAVT